MVILHIASISNNKSSGMSVVIPEHVKYQGKYETTALLNLNNEILDSSDIKIFNLVKFNDNILKNLPYPFSNPDLIVLHGIYYMKFVKLYKLIKKENIPYVLIPHGCLSKNSIKRKYIKKKIALTLFLNKIITNANAIQYLSDDEKNNSLGKKINSFVSPNGININKNIKIKNKDKSAKAFELIYVGRLSIMHKGLDLLLESVNLIQDYMRENNIRLSIYGPDVDKEKNILIDLCRKYNIEDIVYIYNGIFGDEKINTILESDIFIQTSRWEGQPISILEAMSLGKPIIATKGTNMSYEIEKNLCGWSADNDPRSISNAIIKSYKDKELLERYSDNSKNFINENYNWELVAKETIKKYKSVLLK